MIVSNLSCLTFDFSIHLFKVVTRSNIDTLAKSAITVVMDARKDRARRRDTVLSIEAGRIPSKSLGFLLAKISQ